MQLAPIRRGFLQNHFVNVHHQESMTTVPTQCITGHLQVMPMKLPGILLLPAEVLRQKGLAITDAVMQCDVFVSDDNRQGN